MLMPTVFMKNKEYRISNLLNELEKYSELKELDTQHLIQ